MSSNSTIFTGSSRYASDFRQLAERAAGIASLPLLQLQNQRSQLEARSQALQGVDTRAAAVVKAFDSIRSGLGLSSYKAKLSHAEAVSASLAEGVRDGVYTLSISSLGSYSTAMGTQPASLVSDPAQQGPGAGVFQFYYDTVDDGQAISVTPASGSLNALADAINQTVSGVQATVVNVGGGTADYRLSLQATKLGAHTMQIKDPLGAGLLAPTNPGSLAEFQVNGSPTAASETRTLTLSPGLTVDLLQTTTSSATIAIERNPASLKKALEDFAGAYNALGSELDKHRGEGAGALSGDSLVGTVAGALRGLGAYAGPGSLGDLTAIGLVFDDKGRLSVDSTLFDAAAKDGLDALQAFFGEAESAGFLKSAETLFESLTADETGFLDTGLTALRDQLDAQDDRIAAEEERIERVREATQAELAAADALIASLEQQVQYFNGMFESMRIAQQGM